MIELYYEIDSSPKFSGEYSVLLSLVFSLRAEKGGYLLSVTLKQQSHLLSSSFNLKKDNEFFQRTNIIIILLFTPTFHQHELLFF